MKNGTSRFLGGRLIVLTRSLVLLVALTVFVPACRSEGKTLYETETQVIQAPGKDAMLCLGGVAESLPPQCDGPVADNWDWDEVSGEESRGGTTWGGPYHLVGTFDGTSFTVKEASGPVKVAQPEPSNENEIPCPEPDGGWTATDPTRSTDAHLNEAVGASRSQPNFAGVWVSYLTPPSEEKVLEAEARGVSPDASGTVLILAFTEDLELREQDARGHWGGPLCMVRHDHSYSELKEIESELQGDAGKELGLQLLSSGVHESSNVLEVGVVVIDEDTRQILERRYGKGLVISAALTPVRN